MSDQPETFDFARILQIPNKQNVSLHSLPNGAVGKLLSDIARHNPDRALVYIAPQLSDANTVAESIAFYGQEKLESQVFPAWDCAPYDRSSPSDSVQAERARLLHHWAHHGAQKGRWTIIPMNALLQRYPALDEYLKIAPISVQLNDRMKPEELALKLVHLGFHAVDMVFRPGEFVRRGSIFDLYPAGAELPIRLDFFGDTIESISCFDPLNQRRESHLEAFEICPSREIILDPESIQRFRQNYRELFGLTVSQDPVFSAVSDGVPYRGMEHWLPLFYQKLSSLMVYFNDDTLFVLGKGSYQGAMDKFNEIKAYYEMRQSHYEAVQARAPSKQREETLAEIVKPLSPEILYPTEDELNNLLQKNQLLFLEHIPELSVQKYSSPYAATPNFLSARALGGQEAVMAELQDKAQDWKGKRKLVISHDRTGQLKEALEQSGFKVRDILRLDQVVKHAPDIVYLHEGLARGGFIDDKLVVLDEYELLGINENRRSNRQKKAKNMLLDMTTINEGDLVTHIEHGIGRYLGLSRVDTGSSHHDCLKIEYAEGGILYLPVVNIELISLYGEADAESRTLDRLGGAQWQARKARVRGRIKDIAEGLMALAAKRHAISLAAPETDWDSYNRFKNNISFTLTEDQQGAIDDLLDDVGRGYPMDRLICGDVGFGKTEIAMHAIFLIAQSGGQVAVLAPTTLLAAQHYRSMRARMQGFGFKIALRSRANNTKEAQRVVEDLQNGSIDIVVGTHALFSKSIQFKNLQLLIIDEEQRFGVAQKEHLKSMRTEVHVLSLSATPIPRTLNMALSGVRDLSLIATAPVDRIAIRTILEPYDEISIQRALMREKDRDGLSYFVTPRIKYLAEIENMLRRIVPELRFMTAHGRMKQAELDHAMQQFSDGSIDILLATSIIESGIDVARANTMIVHRPDLFGLSQLYQIRGRIGRSNVRANCYLCLPKRGEIHQNAAQRLEVLQTLDTLGAGFNLAHHDMDLRGAGNLVGAEQSGHMNEVGIELYHKMLSDALEAIKAGEEVGTDFLNQRDKKAHIEINLGVSVGLPEDYISDLAVRLSQYRKIARLENDGEISAMREELRDRFGSIPLDTENLLQMVAIKVIAQGLNIEKIDGGSNGLAIKFHENQFLGSEGLIKLMIASPQHFQQTKDQRLLYSGGKYSKVEQRLWETRKFLELLQTC